MVACLQIGGLFEVGRGNPGWGRGAKVHQHRRVVLGQQHIVRFDVPVLELLNLIVGLHFEQIQSMICQ